MKKRSSLPDGSPAVVSPPSVAPGLSLAPVSDRLLRLPEVLGIVPVSPSAWWEGVKQGRFPKGRKLSPKITVWKLSEIHALIEGLDREAA